MLKLLLIRHAESLGNLEGRMEGQSSTGLSERGMQQAHQLGRHLAATDWQPTAIYCSPLLRATQTLTAMGSTLGWQLDRQANPLPVPVTWDPNLREYANGCFQGLTWIEAQQQYPQLCQQLETSLDWLPIPGAETLEAGRSRATEFWQQVLETHQTSDRLWIISHQWLLQQLLSVILGCDRTWAVAMGHTACFEIWLDRDRWCQADHNRWNSELWQLRRFNDCKHLQG
ncbi:histidine phosphatase family protein [filamentous cyanobacterium CCP5]|nr:histidine phosphatase family protein [filamentous cyanobacterium CCP5]